MPRSSFPSVPVWLAAAAIGVAAFLVIEGPRVLDPTYLNWLLWGDRGYHLSGWFAFRQAAWALPLGAAPGLLAPIGGSVALVDAIPWAAVAAKLADPLLPTPFQYFGIWRLSCYVGLGVAGALLAGAFAKPAAARLAAAAFAATTPQLAMRNEHLALGTWWIVLLGVWIAVEAARGKARWPAAIAASVFVAGVHPYLGAMLLALLGAATASRLSRMAWRDAALLALAFPAWLGTSALFGYFAGPAGAEGWGLFNADVLSTINPLGASALVPRLPAIAEQEEGFAYAGIAGWAAAAAGLLAARRSISWRWAPIAAAILGMSLFALSTTVRVGGVPVLRLEWLDAVIGPLGGVFRSSGRFAVPLALTAPIIGIALAARWIPAKILPIVVGAALAANVAELAPAYAGARASNTDEGRYGLRSPLWSQLGEFHALVLLPPYIWPRVCYPGDFAADDGHRWAVVAHLNRLSINSGSLGRLAPEAAAALCRDADDVLHGRAPTAPDAVYILRRGTLATFEREAWPRVVCGYVDGHAVCVSAQTPSRLREEFSRPG